MERVRREWPRRPGDFTVEAVAAMRAIRQPGTAAPMTETPLLLGCFPTFGTNPYQALLYSAAREHGIAPVFMYGSSQLAELHALAAAGLNTVLHLHWLHVLTREATSAEQARELAARAIEELDAYVAVGGRIVWTVHNILPHDAKHEAVEVWLASQVASRSAAIHVMATNTVELVAPFYELPRDRVFVVPHPGFGRTYADSISRLDARHELGIDPDELVAAVVGAIRPYKGIDDLLDAWARFEPGSPKRLVIAGTPAPGPTVAALLERAALEPNVLLDARRLEPDELQLFLRAADVAVLPYKRSLNSSALLLALTFGLPVIVPEGGGLEEMADPAFARTFTGADVESLLGALRSIPELLTTEARAAAVAVAAALDPLELSHRFASELRARLAATDFIRG
jgi:beta-1,4-mannosyltransferase